MTSTQRCDSIQDMLELETTTDFGEEEDDIDSCSTFSLQQCIEEFRARRIRRNSAHVSEQHEEQLQQQREAESAAKVSLADTDLINQNRSNKEHERKYKPCRNGFCYCFTSDSGDGGGCKEMAHVRHARRSRKSESAQHTCVAQSSPLFSTRKERRSAPANLKTAVSHHPSKDDTKLKQEKKSKIVQSTNARCPIMAISRLETTTHDAPLIHIIQELRDNCVVSEVRVNRHKLQQKRSSRESNTEILDKPKTMTRGTTMEPTAPSLKELSSTNSTTRSKPPKVNTPSGDLIPVSRLEINAKSPRRKSGGGRLLQKRLSHSNVQYKPWDMTEAPPKPPRASTGSRLESLSSSISTSSSVREAERVVDDFLTKKGVSLPRPAERTKNIDSVLSKINKKLQVDSQQNHLPTCPSLSDIERIVDGKPEINYGKNIKQTKENTIKDITLGWKEAKVSEMLAYDSNGNQKEFKSQSAQAEPQTMGWQIPPKLSLDTVDGSERHNLVANLETKDTPIKHQFSATKKEQQIPRFYPKFGWRNLSPWTAVTPHGSRMRKCPKSTTAFLKQSKKKILRLVTPKKDNKEHNFQARKTPFRTVGIQTSPEDFGSYENSTTPQSPPGSYHSAVQTPHQCSITSNAGTQSQNNNPSDSSQFDFTRKVNSPPKKATRTSQRKLDFPSVGIPSGVDFVKKRKSQFENSNSTAFPSVTTDQCQKSGTRTYRSYQTDLDQDVTISKMGFILSNIRARLEASDELAVRTFEEIERREQQERGFDCPDSLGIRQRTSINVHPTYIDRGYIVQEPIYSEIEEDSIHVTESPQFENKTGIESSCSASEAVDLEMLYAKVKKCPKKNKDSIPLGKFLHNSLQRTHKEPRERLPTLPEPSISNVSYSSPPLETSVQNSDCESPTPSLIHSQSLNNIRVMEHKSPPKPNRNLSKSDLSLQRSEIFLENLCRSELIVEDGTLDRLEKVDNLLSNREPDYISYDLPDELNKNVSSGKEENPVTKTSPQKFLTKPLPSIKDTHDNGDVYSCQLGTHCSSCPVTPQKFINSNQQMIQSNSQPDRLNNTIATEVGGTTSGLARYKRLKQMLQNSLRKGKNFVKYRRASLTPNSTQPIEEQQTLQFPEIDSQADGSCLNLDSFFALDESVPVAEQIVRAVNICRQLPELETTPEMVEAERLLLFTTLRHDTWKQFRNKTLTKSRPLEGYKRDFFLDNMYLPVNLETNLDGFFNYYFTITFECDGQVLSTQSTECRQNVAVFQHCNIEFHTQKYSDEDEPCINCNVFMLRLRRINTLSNDPKNRLDMSPEPSPLCSTPTSSMSSLNHITSRFRLYASFTINAQTFRPFVFGCDTNENEPDLLCLSSSNTATESIKVFSKHKSLDGVISIDGRVTVNFKKDTFSGFLHVQDPFSQHNWNRRWCKLIGLQLEVWADMNSVNEVPLLTLTLHGNTFSNSLPITPCTQECARKRSFCFQCLTSKTDLEVKTVSVFFAAENEKDLEEWLQQLNKVFYFISSWMQ